jgi:putative FmdB family regulatory protein
LPTYEYACTACGHRLEAVQKFSEDALTDCPECRGRLRKIYAPVGIVLKGSGFYKTDSRTNGNGKKASAGGDSSSGDGSSKSDSSNSDSGKSDSGKSDSSSGSDSGSKSDTGSKTESSKPAAAAAS